MMYLVTSQEFTGVVSGTNDNLDTITVKGSPALKSRIRILLEHYRDVFSPTLSEVPAIIPPFDL
jgi:hypothetical protein